MELRGTYVVLRPLQVEDAELTLRWRLSDRANLLNQGAVTVAEQVAWISSRPAGEFNFIIELASGQPVGMLSLVDRSREAHRPAATEERMLTSTDVDTIIFRALTALNAERAADEQIGLSPATPLFGVDSEIDSLGFVSVITDVETTLVVDHGMNIPLADDRAMTRAQSPYDTVSTLRDYILELVEAR